MNKLKLVILDGATLNPGDLSWEDFEKYADVTIYKRSDSDQIIQRCNNADAVIINKVIFDESLIKSLPKLRYIGVTATGYNIVDIKAAQKYGVTVTNIPAYATMSVAQTVFAHILQFTHNIALHADSVRHGEWTKSLDFCYQKQSLIELAELNLGIIGFGNSGKAVAKIAQSFGMNVLIYARKAEKIFGNIKQVALNELFTNSDFITLHCPLNTDSNQIINKNSLKLMRNTAYLINTGRGGLINEEDLALALNNEQIAGAGLDVLSFEPPLANNPLLKAKNCNITPHIAWASYAARKRAMDITLNNFISFLEANVKNQVTI